MQEIRLGRSVRDYIWTALAGIGWACFLIALCFYLGYVNG